MTLVFSKEKMLQRMKATDRMKYIDEEILAIMDTLDMQPVQEGWKRKIFNHPYYSCIGRNREKFEVYEGDCVER